MSASTQDNIWATFVPLRDEVRKAVDSGIEVEEAVATQWQETRNQIVQKYYYLVERVAESMSKKITEVEKEALASMGVDGLYDAVDGFEPERPDVKTGKVVKFETYAVYRIKGSIIDEIRRDDWVPRLVRSRARKIDRTRNALMADLGREPTNEEMADALSMPLDEYTTMLKAAALKSVQSINVTFGGKDNDSNEEMAIVDCVRDPSTYEPLESLIQEELKSKLFGKGFTPLERRIIHSYYFEGRSMKEISEAIGLSESRVSQMNTDIIKRLQEKVRRNPEYFGKQVYEMLKR